MNVILKNIILEKDYYIKIIILFLFWKLIKQHPELKKVKPETAFSVYRSLMCLFFMLYSLDNTINNFSDLFNRPLYEKPCFTDICSWFVAYLIVDIIKLIMDKNTRIDLYVHHAWCLGVFLIYKYYDNSGILINFVLVNEAISIVSGIDLIAMEKNDMKESYYYKKYRRNIIRYLRLPVWILLLLFTIRHTDKMNNLCWWSSILTSFLMLGLDHYWEKKCDKVVQKYTENKF